VRAVLSPSIVDTGWWPPPVIQRRSFSSGIEEFSCCPRVAEERGSDERPQVFNTERRLLISMSCMVIMKKKWSDHRRSCSGRGRLIATSSVRMSGGFWFQCRPRTTGAWDNTLLADQEKRSC
jgi:hypothetical protein